MGLDSFSRPAGTAIERGQTLILASDGNYYPEGSSAIPDDGMTHGAVAIAISSVIAGEFVGGELLGGRRLTRALVRAEDYAVVPGLALAVPEGADELGLAGVMVPVGAALTGSAYSNTAFAAEALALGETKLLNVIA